MRAIKHLPAFTRPTLTIVHLQLAENFNGADLRNICTGKWLALDVYPRPF